MMVLSGLLSIVCTMAGWSELEPTAMTTAVTSIGAGVWFIIEAVRAGRRGRYRIKYTAEGPTEGTGARGHVDVIRRVGPVLPGDRTGS